MDIANKTFNLYKEKATNVILCQATIVGAIFVAIATFALGYDKEYTRYFILLILLTGVAFFLYYEFKYREYQRDYVGTLVLYLIRDGKMEGKKENLVNDIHQHILFSKDTISLSIDDLVEREYLNSIIRP